MVSQQQRALLYCKLLARSSRLSQRDLHRGAPSGASGHAREHGLQHRQILLANGARQVAQLAEAALHVGNGCLSTPQLLRAVRPEECGRQGLASTKLGQNARRCSLLCAGRRTA